MSDESSASVDALARSVANLRTEIQGAQSDLKGLLSSRGSGVSPAGNALSSSLGGFSGANGGLGSLGGFGGGNSMAASMGSFGGKLSAGLSGLAAGLNIAGTGTNVLAALLPNVQDTMRMSGQYYQTSLLTPGANKYGVATSTFNAMKGGITSPGSSAMVAQGLSSMGIQFSTNQNSAYQTMLRETKNAAMYLGQDNMTAMNAVAGLGTGSMSANLTATMGIYTSNFDGSSKNQNQIFSQIWSQMRAGQGKMTSKDVMDSFYKGNLGASLTNLGFTEPQKAQFLQYAVNQVGGKSMDLSNNAQMKALMNSNNAMGNANPLQSSMNIYSTQTDQMTAAMKPYEKGMKDAADLYQQLNPEVKTAVKQFGEYNAFMQTFLATNPGKAMSTLVGSLGTLITDVLGILASVKAIKMVGNAVKGGSPSSDSGSGSLGKNTGTDNSKTTYKTGVKNRGVKSRLVTPESPSVPEPLGKSIAKSTLLGLGVSNAVNEIANDTSNLVDITQNNKKLKAIQKAHPNYTPDQAMYALHNPGKKVPSNDSMLKNTLSDPGFWFDFLTGGGVNGKTNLNASSTMSDNGMGIGGPKGSNGGGKASTLSKSALAGLTHAAGGAHVPANGPITAHLHQMGAMWGANGHNGTDYGVPDGSPIYAVADGKVSTDATGAGARSYGHYITLDHGNGYKTLYAHLDPSSADVHPGDTVKAGQIIGKSGHSGHVTGPHLHFEVLKNGSSVDPGPVLAGSLSGGSTSDTTKASPMASNVSAAASPSLFAATSSGFTANSWSVAEAMGTTVAAPAASYTSTGSLGTSAGASPGTTGGSPVDGKYGGIGLGASSLVSQSTGSSGRNIEINLQIASASAQEARQFAEYVKQILQEDSVTSNMGSR